MRNTIAAYLDDAITFVLLLVAGLTPLLFLDKTTEFFESPKLIFLVLATLLLLGMWIFSWILKGKVIINKTPLDIPLLLLLGTVLVSTFFAPLKNIAIYGNFPRVHGSAVSLITYILLYFVTVSNLKSLNKIKTFLYVLFGSVSLVAVLSILSFFHIYLPISFAQAVNFTTTGSTFSTVALLLMLLPLPLISLSHPNKYVPVGFAMALSILFGVTIVLTGSVSAYILLAIEVGLCVLAAKPQKNNKTLPFFIAPLAITALALIVAFVPVKGNIVQQLENNFPKEIQLPFVMSWKVSASAFRDATFVGTGPTSYLFDFSLYKPADFNNLAYWNVSFDSAYNEFLQVLGTLGGIGFFSLTLLCIVIFVISWRNLSVTGHDAGGDNSNVIIPSLALSSIVSVLLLLIHATTLVSFVGMLFILAAFMMSQKNIREKVLELSIGISASTADNKKFDLFPILVFIVYLVVLGVTAYNAYFIIAADYYHRQALAQTTNGTAVYQYLQKAETLNPQNDSYRVDMSQTNFALANALAIQKGPSTSNPQGSLTDQDKQTIQTLLSQSINEGRAAVTLNPLSPRNWEVLALVYRNISGIANNALAFSLNAYGSAIQRDPLNPGLRINVGGIYATAKNYDLAIRFYTDAVNLKPDYANAYFNLALALQAKGDLPDLQNALPIAQQAMVLLQNTPTSSDYKTASALADQLKKQISAGTNQTAQQSAQSQTGLQNPNLQNVNVSGLQNPPSPTPIPSVKPNPNSRIPEATVTPTK